MKRLLAYLDVSEKNSDRFLEVKFQKGKLLLYYFLVAVFATLVYSNHFSNGFHFDDSHTVVNNIFIQNLKNIPLFFKDGTTFSSLPTNQSYRPLVTTTLAVDYRIGGGLNPFWFHLSTFVLFLLQGLLMLLVFLKIFSASAGSGFGRNPVAELGFVSLFAVAWYLIHPAIAETINYVIARSDSLSTFFVVLALILYMYSPFCRKYFLYLIPVAFGALAKIPAIMFAPILLVYIILFEKKVSFFQLLQKRHSKVLLSILKMVLPTFVFCTGVYFFIHKMDPETWTAGGLSRYHYLITQPYVILHYVKTFFFPLWLSADTDWVTFDTILNLKAILGFLFIALLFLVAVLSSNYPKLRPVSFGIFWFFFALIPSSSVIPLAEVMNDHRLFFPYVGLVLAVCWLIYIFISGIIKNGVSGKIIFGGIIFFCMLFLGAYAYGTRQRNKVWATDETLWKDVTEKSPGNPRGLMNYGLVLMARADYDGAEKYFRKGIEQWPYYAYLHINMGILKGATDHEAEAETYFKNAIKFRSDLPECYYYYAEFLQKQNRIDEAIPMLIKTLQLSQAHTLARYQLMAIYFDRGEFEKLDQLANETLKILPNDAQAKYYLQAKHERKSKLEMDESLAKTNPTPENFLSLSLDYYNAGRFEDCIKACEEALKLRPDYDYAYNNICSAYNMLGKWDKAIEAGKKAVALNPSSQLAKNNLEWAEQHSGK